MQESFSEYSHQPVVFSKIYHNYKLIRLHGRSAIGTVSGHGRRWFVKSLAPDLADSSQAQLSLKKEFDILVSLNHPGIVRAIDFEVIEGAGPSIIMEFLEGDSLLDSVKDFSRKQRRNIAMQMVDVISYLHNQGVTHGDLKPQNLVVATNPSDARIKLIDFNLSDTADFIYDKEAGGNRVYGAPEQFEKGYRLQPTADVWSLGLLLKDLDLGFLWKSAIRKALRVNPEKRPQSGAELKKIINKTLWRFRLSLIIAALLFATASIGFIWRNNDQTSGIQSKSAGVESSKGSDSLMQTPPVANISTNPEVNSHEDKKSEDKELRELNQRYIAVESEVAAGLYEKGKEIEKLLADSTMALKPRYNALSKILLAAKIDAGDKILQFRYSLPDKYKNEWPTEWDGLFNQVQVNEFYNKYEPLLKQMIEEMNKER